MEAEIINHAYNMGLFIGLFAGIMLVAACWFLTPGMRNPIEDVDEHLWRRRADERHRREEEHVHHRDYPS